MKILAIDTSAKAASAAILEDDRILAESYMNIRTTHSQTILPLCDSILKISGLSLSEMDCFAVSGGPGSFTGLRIGISAIKGFAFAGQKPCVHVSTLDAIAQNGIDFDGIICAVMDARCKQVYNALYEIHNGALDKLTEDRALLLDELLEELKTYKKSILLVGDGADLCYNQFQEQLSDLHLAAPGNRYQRASSVAMLAHTKALRGEVVSADQLLPSYLRLPQAQRERLSRGESIDVKY